MAKKALLALLFSPFLLFRSCVAIINPSDLPVSTTNGMESRPKPPDRPGPIGRIGLNLRSLFDASLHAQAGGIVRITVAETAGLRRTEYPVKTEVQLPTGGASDISRLQLRSTAGAVPAQFIIINSWPNGSLRTVDVAFNITLEPGENRELQLAYGAEVSPAAAPARGLMVAETPDAIQIGSVKFNRSGMPLMTSASYVRSEFIASFEGAGNGLSVADVKQARHDLSTARNLTATLVAPGPLLAILRYSGTWTMDGADVPFTLTIEMPNSKSWIKMSASVTDTGHRVQRLSIDTPLALGAFPWQWDISTENGSYGAFRNATDAMTFTQVIPEAARSPRAWRIEAGAAAKMNLVESSVPATANSLPPPAWRAGHLQGSNTAVAFAIDRVSESPGEYTISLNGQGQASYRFAPAATATTHSLIVYQHFVSTPVAIGAATSPASMLQPPQVK